MSDFFKKFKNVFVVDDGNSKKKNATKISEVQSEKIVKKAISKTQVPTTSRPVTDTQVKPKKNKMTTKAQVDPKFMKILLRALEKNDQEGYDYLEFKSTLKSLDAMDMDEKTRYQSAEAMAKAMGVTVENIVRSADFYLQVLAQEEKLFEDALKNQHSEKVIGKQLGIKDLKKHIELAEQKILNLQEEIEQAQNRIDQIDSELKISLNKMNSTKENFILTYESMMDQIKQDRNKIIKYLK